MNLWTIVPVNSLQETKSRLRAVLTLGERARLTEMMLRRTLGILQMVTAVSQTIVVSRDPIVAEIASAANCQAIAEPAGSGLNGAVTLGAAVAAESGATHLLVLPSDLPFLRQDELELLLSEVESAASSRTLHICSDRQQQGTNGLVLPAGSGFRFAYGRHSYHHHLEEAARLGWMCQTHRLPSIQFDLDTEEDYIRYTNKMAVQGEFR